RDPRDRAAAAALRGGDLGERALRAPDAARQPHLRRRAARVDRCRARPRAGQAEHAPDPESRPPAGRGLPDAGRRRGASLVGRRRRAGARLLADHRPAPLTGRVRRRGHVGPRLRAVARHRQGGERAGDEGRELHRHRRPGAAPLCHAAGLVAPGARLGRGGLQHMNPTGASGGQAAGTYAERRPLPKIEASIPASYYFDPQHYERELDVFWYRMWVVAAREEELPGPRHYRVVKIGPQSILILRDLEGRLRAFHNPCRHRGSILCTEEAGRLPGRRIVCPYHNWTYGLDGQLAATPRRMETSDFELTDYPLFGVAVDTWGGFVFVNLAGDAAPPLAQALGDMPARFKNYGFADLRIGK